jgi:hypothetical protein
VRGNGIAIEFANRRFRENREMGEMAVRNNGFALGFLSGKL